MFFKRSGFPSPRQPFFPPRDLKANSTRLLCMYHDQGLIPFKGCTRSHSGRERKRSGCRFSPHQFPTHGTAFENCGAKASRVPDSMIAAINLAVESAGSHVERNSRTPYVELMSKLDGNPNVSNDESAPRPRFSFHSGFRHSFVIRHLDFVIGER